MMKKAKPKKKGKTYYRHKGCEEAKKRHRMMFPYCEICGKTFCKIDAHHLLTVGAYPEMSNQDENIISVCVHCHRWGKISFHGSGTDEMKKLRDKKFPGKMAKLRRTALKRKNVDYEKEYREMKLHKIGECGAIMFETKTGSVCAECGKSIKQ
ncbi:MAG TPA: hypothetical protein VK255_03000 [Patescibacteria group bacterium]|nr:hypothetical protein [Patescibacteria group bacterium]